jgi:hypothetical protein
MGAAILNSKNKEQALILTTDQGSIKIFSLKNSKSKEKTKVNYKHSSGNEEEVFKKFELSMLPKEVKFPITFMESHIFCENLSNETTPKLKLTGSIGKAINGDA